MSRYWAFPYSKNTTTRSEENRHNCRSRQQLALALVSFSEGGQSQFLVSILNAVEPVDCEVAQCNGYITPLETSVNNFTQQVCLYAIFSQLKCCCALSISPGKEFGKTWCLFLQTDLIYNTEHRLLYSKYNNWLWTLQNKSSSAVQKSQMTVKPSCFFIRTEELCQFW